MQVFIIGSPLETAQALDAKRLHKQIVEVRQIIDAHIGQTKAWLNHPCTRQYWKHTVWLKLYEIVLKHHRDGYTALAEYYSRLAEKFKPDFHTPEYFDQMKRRLYTKDPNHYSQWAHLGSSDVNWYYVDGAWKHYKNGKLIKTIRP